MPVVSDSFNRANSGAPPADPANQTGTGTLGNADTGQTWVVDDSEVGAPVTSWGINTNQAWCTDAQTTGSVGSIAIVDAGISDVEVECDFPVVTATDNGSPGLVWRTSAYNNGFRLICYRGGVGRVFGGPFVSFPAIVSGDHVKVVAVGDTHTIYVNGSQVATFTSSANQTVTTHGLYAEDSTANRWDNFTIDAAVASRGLVLGPLALN